VDPVFCTTLPIDFFKIFDIIIIVKGIRKKLPMKLRGAEGLKKLKKLLTNKKFMI